MSRRTPVAHLSRRYHFAASHRLHSDVLDRARNAEIYGKCNNPHGHGHNYTVEITVAGEIDAATGMVTNMSDLDRFAHERLLARFDHQNLNLLDVFRAVVPTTENLAQEVWRSFAEYPHAQLVRVRVEETDRNSFEITQGQSPA